MKQYKITLMNLEDSSTKNETVERLTFPEAVHYAYKVKNMLGFEWAIKSIVEVGS